MPEKLSLPARAVAEYLTARPATRDSVLRPYARPADEQVAIAIMHNPVRKSIRELLTVDNSDVLARVEKTIATHKRETDYDKKWLAACTRSLVNVRAVDLEGTFEETHKRVLDLDVEGLRVRTSVDFIGTYTPSNRRMKPRRVGVIVNIPGLQMASKTRRDEWMRAECELAFRTLAVADEKVEAIFYIDLPSRAIMLRYLRPNQPLWNDIQAICRQIVREFPRILAEEAKRPRRRKSA